MITAIMIYAALVIIGFIAFQNACYRRAGGDNWVDWLALLFIVLFWLPLAIAANLFGDLCDYIFPPTVDNEERDD